MYCPLHSHTYASNLRFLDCINRPKEMVEKAISLGFSGIAFTDHEALSAAITILKVRDEISKDHPDFKIIFGNEIYLIDENSLKNTNDYFHFILLAKDLTGWNQIKTLSSRAWERGYTEKGILRVPTTYQDLEEIVKSDPGHVFGATACLGGQLPKQILSKDVDGANRFVKWCIDVFGKDNFALELQPSDSEEQITVNKVLIKFGKAYGVQNIVTTDMHYLNKEDFAIHSAFLNSRSSSDRETEKFYKYTYMMTIDEMVELLSKSDLTVEESLAIIDNTGKIADQVENYDFRHSTIVPKIKIPEFSLSKALYHKGYKAIDNFYDSEDEQDRYLMYQIEKGILDKNVVIDNERLERINTELDVLEFLSERLNQKLSAYLNLTVNIIDIAWQASLVAPGRGCFAPGSPVMLANGETKPIEEVQIGDMVITHTGNMRKVYNVLNYDVNEELYSVKTTGGRELTCTNNHKIYAVKRGKCANRTYKNVYCNSNCRIFDKCLNRTADTKFSPDWVEAQDLSVGDYIAIPKAKFTDDIKTTTLKYSDYVPEWRYYDKEQDIVDVKNHNSKYTGETDTVLIKNNLEITDELCKLFGYFVGNGWTCSTRKQIGVAFHSCQTQKIEECAKLIQQYFNITPTIIKHATRQAVQVVFYSKPIWFLFHNLFGENASNKRIPEFVFESRGRMINCLKGLAETDGSISWKGQRFKYSTTSSELQKQVNYLLESLGILGNLKTYDNKLIKHPNWSTEKIVDVSGYQFRHFVELVYPDKINEVKVKEINSVIKEDTDYFYVPVRKITKAPYIGKVYDLSVEEDTSYNINGLAVHNSSTGFYINYLIGIVQVDPLKYGLCYWRFLNKERVELPDVDSDFQPEKTADIIQLLRDEYGEDNVLNCATFKTESLKSAILSVGRGLGFNNDDMQALAALVPSHRGQTYTLKECLEGDEEKGFDPVPDFASKLNAFPGLLKGVEKIEGLPTNTSIHASALYVFNDGYLAQNSLMRAPNKTKITAFSMHDSDDMGALKMDVLRTDAQSKIAKCIELLLKDRKIEWKGSLRDTYDSILHPDLLSYDNPEMWENMSNGQIPNLFQFDTSVGGVCIKKARPTNVMELAEINSIMRLQADGEQPIDRYVRFNKNPEMWDLEMAEEGLNEKEISIMHKYLDGSHGVSGSQEVLMRILMDPDVCNFTLGEANMARKAIAKKQAAKLIQLKKDFYEKGKLTPDN